MDETSDGVGLSALPDRGVVEVAGADAPAFLQGLVTNDVLKLASGEARYAALLTPQGKILFDFLVVADSTGGAFLLDCPRALATDLVKRLSMYRLRAKVTVADLSENVGVAAAWGPAQARSLPDCRADYSDPRRKGMGRRMILTRAGFSSVPAAEADYERHRLEHEVPKGGVDFAYGDTFPHEANLDRLNGVDFKKGCYVGQEVVSRVEHRGTARKRIVAVRFAGTAPEPRTPVTIGGIDAGTMGSALDGKGLALIRIDRAQEAAAAGTPILAGATELTILSAPA